MHVSVDTFSGAVYASAHTGEKSGDAIKHLIQAFSFLGIPKSLKTDNRPTYKSKEFRSFLQQWGVEHKKDIPHSLTGQAIVERTHKDLKRVLCQQQQVLKVEPSSIWLAKALFTINFLNCSFEVLNPPIVCHFAGNQQLALKARPKVLVKDLETLRTEGPHSLVMWGCEYACVSTPTGLQWIPSKWVRPYIPKVSGQKVSQVTFYLVVPDLVLSQMEVPLSVNLLQLFLLASLKTLTSGGFVPQSTTDAWVNQSSASTAPSNTVTIRNTKCGYGCTTIRIIQEKVIRCVFENSWRRGVMEEGQCHPSVPKGQERPAGCAAIQPDLDRLEKNSGKLS
ncbi:hypothetical protein HGM15179_008417 [Zosterops borbonicus]|uniref:Integrase catalytic domain-containing protein n=1 Tax=Zosterops borbonicus TaxID=364589 RepID=A0A8K1LLS5_9PASS|nr:hypothetical protein HGM15179_008417 [Zosterops borbonicus]